MFFILVLLGLNPLRKSIGVRRAILITVRLWQQRGRPLRRGDHHARVETLDFAPLPIPLEKASGRHSTPVREADLLRPC